MKTKSLVSKLSRKYPKRNAQWYDYPGLQVSHFRDETKCVLLCLDFDSDVFKYIKDNNLENKIDLIITHHPFIYGKRKEVLENDYLKEQLVEELEKLNLPVLSFHTNFDNADDGMNDVLTTLLELKNVRKLVSDKAARGGDLPKTMTPENFAKYAINKLGVDYGLLMDYGVKEIKSVAIVGGGGWKSYKSAQLESFDAFISSDMPHHARRDIALYKFNYLDIPHEVEKAFIPFMKEKLLSIDSSLEIITVDHEKMPKVICK